MEGKQSKGYPDRLSNPLPPYPLINHQRYILELHNSFGRNRCDLGDIQLETVVERDDLTAHGGCHHRRLAFHLDGFILPDDEVADLEAEGFLLPGVHSAALSQMAT